MLLRFPQNTDNNLYLIFQSAIPCARLAACNGQIDSMKGENCSFFRGNAFRMLLHLGSLKWPDRHQFNCCESLMLF